jgi:hypothetical protein
LPVPHHGIWFDKEVIGELLNGLNGAFADFPATPEGEDSALG